MILEKISRHQRLEVLTCSKLAMVTSLNQTWAGLHQERVLGVEAVNKYSKLVVCVVGAGKTTFKIYCNAVVVVVSCVHLKANFYFTKSLAETAETELIWVHYRNNFPYGIITDCKAIKQLLVQGRMLILLDGLDEGKETDNVWVLKSVRSFSHQFIAVSSLLQELLQKEYTFAYRSW